MEYQIVAIYYRPIADNHVSLSAFLASFRVLWLVLASESVDIRNVK